MRKRRVAALLFVLVVGLTGCGEGHDVTSSPSTDSSADLPAPAGKSLTGPASAAGRRACQGMTPLEAARRYERSARRAGASARFVELVTEPTPATASSPGYPQLVAAFYASSLAPAKRAAAAAGCAEELAAPTRGGKAASDQTQRENAAR